MPFDPQKSAQLTSVGAVSSSQIASTEKGMAHFAGTSGDLRRCKDCPHFTARSKQTNAKRYCAKYKALTGDGKKNITGRALACRYIDA